MDFYFRTFLNRGAFRWCFSKAIQSHCLHFLSLNSTFDQASWRTSMHGNGFSHSFNCLCAMILYSSSCRILAVPLKIVYVLHLSTFQTIDSTNQTLCFQYPSHFGSPEQISKDWCVVTAHLDCHTQAFRIPQWLDDQRTTLPFSHPA